MRRMCVSSLKVQYLHLRRLISSVAASPLTWQCVERDLRNQMASGERGLVEEYVEKMPNPSLKTFRPVDLSDLKRRNTQDAKKS
uniref:mapk-regulated corepressor-interacting protein 1 isoform X3 n=1 Tax=Podarcis muralis TaxID=64176 RepID=UPI00109F4AA9|nr:mapk-regulated corepressor-interacting protein 1 isoform X3 [Podarcis muralis]